MLSIHIWRWRKNVEGVGPHYKFKVGVHLSRLRQAVFLPEAWHNLINENRTSLESIIEQPMMSCEKLHCNFLNDYSDSDPEKTDQNIPWFVRA